ncbi:MAG: hypothetical protein WKG00_32195 [Polyangiaceae bacterium]
MPTPSPRRRPARRYALPGSLVAASVLSAVVSTGYAGCFLPDYAKQSAAATNGTPGATTGDPGSGGGGARGRGTRRGGRNHGGGPSDPPSDGACVTLTPAAGGAGDGGGAGGTGGAGGGAMTDIQCNPVTNEPCSEGEACDVYAPNGKITGFHCYPDNNTAELCEACNPDGADAEFCVGGLTCIGDVCIRFCCTDADCGNGECKKVDYRIAPGLGVCLAQ